MNLQAIGKVISSRNAKFAISRFRAVRRSYSALQRLRGRAPVANRADVPSIFKEINVDAVIGEIRREAVFVGLNLSTDVTDEIEAFAKAEPLHAIYDPHGKTFYYRDVRRGMCSDGRPMPIGGISEPTRCPAVRKIVEDPVLRTIVSGYLGYEPSRVLTLLDWSFEAEFNCEERRQLKYVVTEYHYDTFGYNFVYANFYISDCNRYSGAHVMMKRSHGRKPLRMLLGSCRASEEEVYAQFGKHNEFTIEGAAGTGFVQDTSCYHRASQAVKGDRLMLAVRFS